MTIHALTSYAYDAARLYAAIVMSGLLVLIVVLGDTPLCEDVTDDEWWDRQW